VTTWRVSSTSLSQLQLRTDRLLDLLRRGTVLLDQQLADARADLEAFVGGTRHEAAGDAAVVIGVGFFMTRREQEQAEFVLDVADRLAGQFDAVGQRQLVKRTGAVR
jgi:hypothetical protein